MKDKIIRQLDLILPDFDTLKDDFFIIGASAMILSGVEIAWTPDIDILTSERDADLIRDLWKERRKDDYQAADDHLFRSNFSRYSHEHLDIEVMGDLEVNNQGAWELLVVEDFYTINIGGRSIKLPSIPEQIRILKRFGREKDLKRISLLEKV